MSSSRVFLGSIATCGLQGSFPRRVFPYVAPMLRISLLRESQGASCCRSRHWGGVALETTEERGKSGRGGGLIFYYNKKPVCGLIIVRVDPVSVIRTHARQIFSTVLNAADHVFMYLPHTRRTFVCPKMPSEVHASQR